MNQRFRVKKVPQNSSHTLYVYRSLIAEKNKCVSKSKLTFKDIYYRHQQMACKFLLCTFTKINLTKSLQSELKSRKYI